MDLRSFSVGNGPGLLTVICPCPSHGRPRLGMYSGSKVSWMLDGVSDHTILSCDLDNLG